MATSSGDMCPLTMRARLLFDRVLSYPGSYANATSPATSVLEDLIALAIAF